MEQPGYGHWEITLISVAFFAGFALMSGIRFKVPRERRPNGMFLAFLVALYAEMYGFPLTIYVLSWAFGYQNPLDHQAGHLLYPYISHEGMGIIGHGITDLMILGGLLLVSSGWRRIHSAGDALVTEGIYSRMRHPQYTGILLMTLGMLLQWPTLLTLGTWPILLFSYYKLARTEERLMESQFGDAYRQYKDRVPMFVPCPLLAIMQARLVQRGLSLR